MAIVMTKKELVGTLATPKTISKPKSDLEKANDIIKSVDSLLKNPLIQRALGNILSKVGINPLQAPPPSLEPKVQKETDKIRKQMEEEMKTKQNPKVNNPFNPTEIYNMILNTIDAVLTLKGDMPLTKLKQDMIDNKDQLIGLIENAIKPKG